MSIKMWQKWAEKVNRELKTHYRKSFVEFWTTIKLHTSDKVSTSCGRNHFALDLLIPIPEKLVRTCIFSTPSGPDHSLLPRRTEELNQWLELLVHARKLLYINRLKTAQNLFLDLVVEIAALCDTEQRLFLVAETRRSMAQIK